MVSTILDRFQTLDDAEKLNLFACLKGYLELDADQLFQTARRYDTDRSVSLYKGLVKFQGQGGKSCCDG